MKMRNVLPFALAVLLLAALAGCTPAENTDANTTPQQTQSASTDHPDTDRSGNPITLPEQVDSIISMAPSATQTLLDLGLKDKLVAVDTYSAMYFGLEDLPVLI